MATVATEIPSTPKERDWTKPRAMAIPKEGYFELEKVATDQSFPNSRLLRLSVIAKIKPGRENAIRDYGKSIEEAVRRIPPCLATLETALSALGSFRHGLGIALHVPGNLRH